MKKIRILNRELDQPYCYERLDESGQWVGVANEYDPERVIPGWIILDEQGDVYWSPDGFYIDPNLPPIDHCPLSSPRRQEIEKKGRAREIIGKYDIRLRDDSHIAVPGGEKLSSQEKNEIIALKPIILEMLRRRKDEEEKIKREKEEAEKREEEEYRSGKRLIELVLREGDYFSGYTTASPVSSRLLEKIGAAHYLGGWGVVVNQEIIQKFGESFSFLDVERYINEKKEAEEEKKREKEREEEEKIKLAKESGKKVLIREYYIDCSDPGLECDADLIKVWAMPDGSVRKERIHTY